MKNLVLFSACLSLSFIGGVTANAEETSKEVSNHSAQETKSLLENQVIHKIFPGRGDAELEKNRQGRQRRYSPLEATGAYAKTGDTLMVEVKEQAGLSLRIGSPTRDRAQTYQLKLGQNTIQVRNDGPVYIINSNDNGQASVSLSGYSGQMPYFSLGETSVRDFQTQMSRMTQARDVQLVSDKAIITVSYERAKKYLENPQELMEYYDRFLLAQDRVSGITDEGKAANRPDRHFQHFVEVSTGYMYASNEYMGFNGDAALERLLKTNNGWGPWHESGHQRQQDAWTWSEVLEATVNIYSLAAQKEVTGRMSALDPHYEAMHSYLDRPNAEKNFNNQSNELKLVMFGQLELTFGEKFYPLLHQYYRENNISVPSNAQKMQHFMLNVAEITGFDMTEYFENWGFDISQSTRTALKQYAPLNVDIWRNDNQTVKQLPLQKVSSVQVISPNRIEVEMVDGDTDLLAGEKIVLMKNGIYFSELTDRRAFNSAFNNGIWRTNTTIGANDHFRIEVRKSYGIYTLYEYKPDPYANELQGKIKQLSTSTPLASTVTQNQLDELREVLNGINNVFNKKKPLEQLEKLEQAYLNTLVNKIELTKDNQLQVHFADRRFRDYEKIVIKADGKYLAEVANGTIYYASVSNNTLRVNDQGAVQNFSVEVRLPHKVYEIARWTK